jgi:hypothetical protein
MTKTKEEVLTGLDAALAKAEDSLRQHLGHDVFITSGAGFRAMFMMGVYEGLIAHQGATMQGNEEGFKEVYAAIHAKLKGDMHNIMTILSSQGNGRQGTDWPKKLEEVYRAGHATCYLCSKPANFGAMVFESADTTIALGGQDPGPGRHRLNICFGCWECEPSLPRKNRFKTYKFRPGEDFGRRVEAKSLELKKEADEKAAAALVANPVGEVIGVDPAAGEDKTVVQVVEAGGEAVASAVLPGVQVGETPPVSEPGLTEQSPERP